MWKKPRALSRARWDLSKVHFKIGLVFLKKRATEHPFQVGASLAREEQHRGALAALRSVHGEELEALKRRSADSQRLVQAEEKLASVVASFAQLQLAISDRVHLGRRRGTTGSDFERFHVSVFGSGVESLVSGLSRGYRPRECCGYSRRRR